MVVAQVDISPVPSTWSLSAEMNKLALTGVGREVSQVCGGCPVPSMSLHYQLGDTTRNCS